MDSQKILETAIQKAIDGGFNYQKWLVTEATRPLSTNIIHMTYSINDLIFNHDFAKALWGEEPGIGAVPGFIDDAPNWQYHLMLMVIAEDPIAYLGENI